MVSILPSLPAYIGLVLALWSSAYVATRTGYMGSTRLVRLALISTGGWWIGVFLSEQAGRSAEARLWQLATLPLVTLAPSLWCLWTARNLPGTPHVPHGWRYLFLLPSVVVALLLAGSAATAEPPALQLADALAPPRAAPAFAVALVSVAGMLVGAATVIVRALDVLVLARDRRAIAYMLAGTLLAALGGLSPVLWPRAGALHVAAQLLLTIGLLAIAYGTVTYTLRKRRRIFTLDAVSSGAVALAISALYLVLFDVILTRTGLRALPFLLAVLAALTTLLIFYGEGLRMLLDILRIGRARQLELKLLRLLARRLGAPRVTPEQMLQETLEEIAHAIGAGRLALVVPEEEGMRPLASFGGTPDVLPSPEALRARRVRACELKGFSHSVPLLEDGDVQGLLLIGGWHEHKTAVHLYSELEYLGTILAVLVNHAYQSFHSVLESVRREEQLDTDQHQISWQLQRFPKAEVFVRVLGGLRLERNGQQLAIPETALGRKQLCHIVAYLVVTRGSYSSFDTLCELTSSRKLRPDFRARLVKAFGNDWKLPDGMVSWNGRQVRFERSEVWYTDIDLIESYLVAAEAELEAGNRKYAAQHFHAAHRLCADSVFPELDFLPDAQHHLFALGAQWAALHKRLLQSYCEFLLCDDSREQRQLAVQLATELARTYADDEAALLAAARLAQGAGQPALARAWRQQAKETASNDFRSADGV